MFEKMIAKRMEKAMKNRAPLAILKVKQALQVFEGYTHKTGEDFMDLLIDYSDKVEEGKIEDVMYEISVSRLIKYLAENRISMIDFTCVAQNLDENDESEEAEALTYFCEIVLEIYAHAMKMH